eukprot:TRINITY_DN93968_c0_g1_i1.p1 TRINITY_DN93968_c0_g1~~TRINITY_DN93968_c0_g1_i1.p1  ORF type:complete len:955 (+),score=216.47 TRINITY_DN93968_c0_g1_i1:61-2925(+)
MDYFGCPQRVVSALLVTGAAFAWQLYREAGGAEVVQVQNALPMLWQGSAGTVFWPPSSTSAPFLALLVLSIAVLVKKTIFTVGESPESRRVRDVKKRLLLAQMTQALRWNAEDTEEEQGEANRQEGEETQNTASDKDKTRKTPPAAADLFEMVYDDVEERHVTEFGIPADAEPYNSTLALFKQRLTADFENYVQLTYLARREADGEPIDVTELRLSSEDLKRLPEFADGVKLTELLELFNKKIKKAFGTGILDKSLLVAAETCSKEVSKAQRKGAAMLWPALRSVLPMYAVALVLMIFDASNGTVVYHSMKTLLDKVGAGTCTLEELKGMTMQAYVKFVFCVFAHLTSWAFTHKVTADFRLKVRNEIMANMMRQDMKFFDFYPSGLLQERLNNDAEQLACKVFHLPIRLTESLFRLMSCVVTLYALDPQFFYVVIAPVPLIAFACQKIIGFMKTMRSRQRKIGEQAAANSMEVLKEIRTVREFCMEREEVDKFAASSAYQAEIDQYASGIHHIVLIAPLCCLFEGVRFVCTYLGGSFVSGGQMTPGQAIMASGLAGDMVHIVRSVFDIIPEIVQTLQPLGRVCDMLSAQPKIEPHPASEPKLKPEFFMGAIEFKNVNFTFPAEPLKQVLFDLSWSISPGEKVGFVGGTGCGKSTSLYLLERWYSPQSGNILLDGRNIQDYDVHYLRQHMSVVAQTTCLFSTTIRENIVYGLPRETREKITDADIEQALKQANAWSFVNDFPRKLETYAGERGVKLSGGQKQRLAIARAIIRKPTLIFLDEATSALDSKAEVIVQDALDKMVDEQKNGCTLIIAHRLSTLRSCDRIIVMDKGSIKECGSHAELMDIPVTKESNGDMITGWYRDLYETQHGKGSGDADVKALKAELEILKQELVEARQENSQLRGETRLKNGSFKYNILNDFPSKPSLVRACSDCRLDENQPPPRLALRGAKTTSY